LRGARKGDEAIQGPWIASLSLATTPALGRELVE